MSAKLLIFNTACLIGSMLVAPLAWAQDCDALTQDVSEHYKHLLATTDTQAETYDAETLERIALRAHDARICYDGTRGLREVWLLNKEVWAHYHLDQMAPAQNNVVLFYERYLSDADAEYRARFALWKLTFDSADGNLHGVVDAYAEFERYAHALPLEDQLSGKVDGALVYNHLDDFEQAIALTTEVLETPTVNNETRARALFERSNALLALHWQREMDEPLLDQVLRDSYTTIRLFNAPRDIDRRIQAYVLLARAQHAFGSPDSVRAAFEHALYLAEAHNLPREIIHIHWRQARLYHAQGRTDDALRSLEYALNLSATSEIPEFVVLLYLEKGKIHEALEEYDAAENWYHLAVNAAPTDVHQIATARALREAQEAYLRMVLQPRDSSWSWVALLGGSLVALGLLALVLHRHRMARLTAPPPSPLPPSSDPSLFFERLTYMHAALQQLLSEDTTGRPTISALYQQAAANETLATGSPISPIAYQSYFKQAFHERKLRFPETLSDWQGFLEILDNQ